MPTLKKMQNFRGIMKEAPLLSYFRYCVMEQGGTVGSLIPFKHPHPENSTSIIGLKLECLRGHHTGRGSTGPQMDDFILATDMRVPRLEHNQRISARPPWVQVCVCACVCMCGHGCGWDSMILFILLSIFSFQLFSYSTSEFLRLLPCSPPQGSRVVKREIWI